MKIKPHEVDEERLASALHQGWGIRTGSIRHLPVGAGSHHWTAQDLHGHVWFVTMDDLGFGRDEQTRSLEALERAFVTARRLAQKACLSFVIAPIPTNTRSMLWRYSPRYAVSVRRMISGQTGQYGEHRPQDAGDVVRLLIQLHQSTDIVRASARRTDLALPRRDAFNDALASLNQKWIGGPLSEPTRALLVTRRDHLELLLDEFDRLVRQVRAMTADWVVTHGEAHPGNLIRTATGLKLIDWDTVKIAPLERDLWIVSANANEVINQYTEETGKIPDSNCMDMYRLGWKLANIANYALELRNAHAFTEDSNTSWQTLKNYLE